MKKKEIIAMILAGGQGSRLGILTKNTAKPAVPFGGKYRIIDFTLSNCSNSGIDTVGVLTQYKPYGLNSHIGIGSPWDLDRINGGVSLLPPYMAENGGEWYKGTANAIYQNIDYIDKYNPEYVLILSGDHIYKMDYSYLLDYHKEKEADATIAVIKVPLNEANRFGIMNTTDDGRVYEFEEKPDKPKSNKASMGVYIFNWKILRSVLMDDEMDKTSSNDFGKNIIPRFLENNHKVFAYDFEGYWKDVGTIESYWEANMDLLNENNKLDIYNDNWKIYTVNPAKPPQYIGKNASVHSSLIVEGCIIYGQVNNSILFTGVRVGENSKIIDSVVMENVVIEDNVIIKNAIIGKNSIVRRGSNIQGKDKIYVVREDEIIQPNVMWGDEVC